MKFNRQGKLKIQEGFLQITMTPMINVIFLLLIFFMLSSSFTFQSGIAVQVPKAVTSDSIKEENFIITVTSENVIYLNNKLVTIKELKNSLTESNRLNRPVLIKSDRRASVGTIVGVWDICRNLGIERINIATDQK